MSIITCWSANIGRTGPTSTSGCVKTAISDGMSRVAFSHSHFGILDGAVDPSHASNHSNTLWYHAMHNRTKRGYLSSVHSGSSSTCESVSSHEDDNVEGKFQTKMDPWNGMLFHFTKDFHPMLQQLVHWSCKLSESHCCSGMHSHGVLQSNDFRESVGAQGETELEVETMQSVLEASQITLPENVSKGLTNRSDRTQYLELDKLSFVETQRPCSLKRR